MLNVEIIISLSSVINIVIWYSIIVVRKILLVDYYYFTLIQRLFSFITYRIGRP